MGTLIILIDTDNVQMNTYAYKITVVLHMQYVLFTLQIYIYYSLAHANCNHVHQDWLDVNIH